MNKKLMAVQLVEKYPAVLNRQVSQETVSGPNVSQMNPVYIITPVNYFSQEKCLSKYIFYIPLILHHHHHHFMDQENLMFWPLVLL